MDLTVHRKYSTGDYYVPTARRGRCPSVRSVLRVGVPRLVPYWKARTLSAGEFGAGGPLDLVCGRHRRRQCRGRPAAAKVRLKS
jgi:hypothetical protein